MNNTEFSNAWDGPQKRIEIKPYHKLYTLDDLEMATLNEWINGDQVEIYRDLNDEQDYAVKHLQSNGRMATARISDCVTINGVRWHLVPGKNIIPKPVYEFLMNCPEQRKLVSRTVFPNQARCIGKLEDLRNA